MKNKRALLLDRDGVLNVEKRDSYIFTREEFIWMDNAKEALEKVNHKFDYIFIVTNQRGIARGMMKEDALHEIHDQLKADLEEYQVHVDGIYYAKGMDLSDPLRKPNPGMGELIEEEFQDIDWSNSLMIGNSLSDMEFAQNFQPAMQRIFLTTTNKDLTFPYPLIDENYEDLWAWANHFVGNQV